KKCAHGVEQFCALNEPLPILRINDQIYIPHAITLLRIGKRIIGFAICFFYNRQWTERFRQYGEFFDMDRDFSSLCGEYVSVDAYDIADIHELLKDGII